MSLFTKSAVDVFSPVNANGTLRGPSPQDAQRWGTEIELSVLGGSAGSAIFTNKATMDANLAYPQHTMAWVISDATTANNGIYRKIGASGAGSWERRGDLPFGFIRATNAGAGTANAIQATTSIPIPAADGAALIALPIVADITGSATVSFNDATALSIKRASGEDVAPGDLRSGMIVAGYKSGTTFRLLNHFGVQFLLATNTGGVNAITATTPTAVPSGDGRAQIVLPISATTTASPVTVSFNGGSALTIKTYDGSDPEPGGLTAGMIIAGYKSGTTFRMLSDQSRAALVAAINAAKAAAEAAQEAAETAQADAEAARDIAAGYASDAASQGNVPIYATVDGMSAITVPVGINAVRVNGKGATGDGNDGLFIEVAGDPDPAPGFQEQGGRWFARADVQFPRGPREWRATWFGLIDHATADQVPVLQKIIDAKAAIGSEPVEVKFPAGTIALNNGATNVPVEGDGIHNLTLKGSRATVFKKTVLQRELFYFARTTRCSNIKFEGFTADGGGIDDTDNNQPLIMVKEGDDIQFIDLYGKNASVAFRVGFGIATVSPSVRPKFKGCVVENVRYNGLEAFNTTDLVMDDCQGIGGAASSGSSNRCFRIVGGAKNFQLSKLRCEGYGAALVIQTDASRDVEGGNVDDCIFNGQTGLAAVWSIYRLKDVTFSRLKIRSGGTTTPVWIGQNEDPAATRSENVQFLNPDIEATASETSLIRMYGVDHPLILGGKLRHVGRNLASSHYAVRFVACAGLMAPRNIVVTMDGGSGGANARGIWDNSGTGGKFAPLANLMHMPNLNQIAQSGSAATAVGTFSATNTYTTYP